MIKYLNIKECLSTGFVLPPLPPFPSREHCCDPTSDHIFSIQNNKPRCALYMNSVGMLHVSDAIPTCIIFVRISLVMRIICTFCFRARSVPHYISRHLGVCSSDVSDAILGGGIC